MYKVMAFGNVRQGRMHSEEIFPFSEDPGTCYVNIVKHVIISSIHFIWKIKYYNVNYYDVY